MNIFAFKICSNSLRRPGLMIFFVFYHYFWMLDFHACEEGFDTKNFFIECFKTKKSFCCSGFFMPFFVGNVV